MARQALNQFLVYYLGQKCLRSKVVSDPEKIEKTEEQWKQELDSETYRVTRQAGTEAAFTGKYCDLKDKGIYNCAACGEPLFSSEAKYDSGSGWPSFYAPADSEVVAQHDDHSHGMIRTEVVCNKCDSHLGHVFPDGPPETGLRYCINSASLDFQEDKS
ncbi:MAG: peptide-methionine (R)-S-oxide reductase [SAR86 cluster bacterium]|uniref:Peptide methionine sulfoxide reductase MsrB n=1 Tax=SAR86 cluster bacterium TaxID=2030880 RepID=A0A2A4WTX3_9GAMM|nr:MAG: peptide-methionine (R)-S-oxide reductase [SAR86 cluster bacterium]